MAPKHVVDLGRIAGLSYIREDGGKIQIGALTTHFQIESSELLKAKSPLLLDTAGQIRDAYAKRHHAGEIHVGGLVASVGQRLLEGAARQMISRFFEGLAREIHSTAGWAAASAPPDSNAAPESPPPPSTASS